MTTLNALLLAGIVALFVIFGIVLAWGDYYTRRGRKSQAAEVPEVKPNPQTISEQRRAA